MIVDSLFILSILGTILLCIATIFAIVAFAASFSYELTNPINLGWMYAIILVAYLYLR